MLTPEDAMLLPLLLGANVDPVWNPLDGVTHHDMGGQRAGALFLGAGLGQDVLDHIARIAGREHTQVQMVGQPTGDGFVWSGGDNRH